MLAEPSSTPDPRWRSDLTMAIGLAACAYVAVRAATLSMTYDEAATYLRYIQNDPGLIFRFDVATNHFLNTALVRLLYAIGGRHDFLLRLPNVAAFPAFLVWTSQVLRRVRSAPIAVATFAIIAANPYVLDFFSLSRGYGLGVAFLIGALAGALDALDGGGVRALRRMAWRGWAAVLANFSTLYAALAVVACGWIADAIDARRRPAIAVAPRPRRAFALLAAVVPMFIVVVVMHDVEVAGNAYVPIVVRVNGLAPDVLDHVAIAELDDHHRPTPFVREERTNVWRQPRASGPSAIRVDLPAAAAVSATLEVSMASSAFTSRADAPTTWTAVDDAGVRRLESGASISLPRSRVPRYGAPINWAGDAFFVGKVGREAAMPIVLWAGFAVLLAAAGRILQKVRLATPEGWRVLALTLLAIAGFAGEPLYLENLRNQLYYGGTVGFLADTVGSLADGTLYDAIYSAAARPWLVGAMWVTFAVFAVVALVIVVRRQGRALVPVAAVLAVTLCAAIGSAIAHVVARTPLPLGRTGLFFLPLFTLFAGLTLDLAARFGRATRAIAIAVSAALASAAVLHLARVASLDVTHEWKRDADSRRVLADVERLAAADGPGRRRVVLGVDRFYSASTTYYALGMSHPAIDVVVEPWPCDYLYVADPHDGSLTHVVERYPRGGGVLARAQ